jgi:hypothetical protein
MKYCNNCGELISDRAKKCRNCGADTRNRDTFSQPSAKYFDDYKGPQEKPSLKSKIIENYQYTSFSKRKSLFFIFPFLIIPGVGIMYAGNIGKGIKFLAVFLAIVFVDVFTKVVLQNYALVFAVIPAYLISIIWGIRAAIKELKIYNQNIESNLGKQYPSKKYDPSFYQ